MRRHNVYLKRTHLLFIAGVVMLSTAITALPKDTALGFNGSSPNNSYNNASPDWDGSYVVRFHRSGDITRLNFSLYSKNYVKPTEDTALKFLLDSCNTNNYDKTARVNVYIGSKKAYKPDNLCQALNQTYIIEPGDWGSPQADLAKRYEVSFSVRIETDMNTASKAWRDAVKDSNDSHIGSSFKVRVSGGNGAVVANRQAKSSTNYGIYGADNRKNKDMKAGYSMEFAPNVCGGSLDKQETGMWDPDSYATLLKLESADRGSNSWSDVSTGAGANRINAFNKIKVKGKDQNSLVEQANGWFKPLTGTGKRVFIFTPSPTKKYRILMATTGTNVVSLIWPYDAIYSDIPCTGWTANSNTTAPATVQVGSTITWTHSAKYNSGNVHATGVAVRASNGTGFGNTDLISDHTNKTVTRPSGEYKFTTSRPTTAADANKIFCRTTTVSPGGGGTLGRAAVPSQACTRVAPATSMIPSINIVPDKVITQGGDVLTQPHISNSSESATNEVRWEVVRFNGPSDRGGEANPSTPCDYFGGDCKVIRDSGTNTVSIQPGETNESAFGNEKQRTSIIPVNSPIGTEYCFALSLTPHQPGMGWYHSEPKCITVVKQPKIQALGGDVRTRSTIQTSYDSVRLGGDIDSSLTMFGSWGAYGGLSKGTSTGFTSAGKFKNGFATGNISDPLLHVLTFGNQDEGHGYYDLPGLPDVTRSAQEDCGAVATFTANTSYSCDESFELPGNTNVEGTVVRSSDGTITITDNIEYNPAAQSNLANLPQMIIFAEDIVINSNVTRVDAWLVSPEGTLKTCDIAEDTELVESDCANRLTINGPVIADKIELLRTAGSDGSKASNGTDPEERLSSPAEVFNLRPDAYLWASTQGAARSYRTTSVVELPPRF